jgi:ABC-type amino acid transport substrate-binding protein
VTHRWHVAMLAGLAVGLACTTAGARSLAAIRDRGLLSLCAHANALPFASKTQDPPGFQIELARALADALGVALHRAPAAELTARQVFAPDGQTRDGDAQRAHGVGHRVGERRRRADGAAFPHAFDTARKVR